MSGNAHPTVGDLLPADVPVAEPRTIPPQKARGGRGGGCGGCVKAVLLLLWGVGPMHPFGQSSSRRRELVLVLEVDSVLSNGHG